MLNICLSGDDMEQLFLPLLIGWSNSTRYGSLFSLDIEIAAVSYSSTVAMFPPVIHRPGSKDLYKNGVSSVVLTLLDLGCIHSQVARGESVQCSCLNRPLLGPFPFPDVCGVLLFHLCMKRYKYKVHGKTGFVGRSVAFGSYRMSRGYTVRVMSSICYIKDFSVI